MAYYCNIVHAYCPYAKGAIRCGSSVTWYYAGARKTRRGERRVEGEYQIAYPVAVSWYPRFALSGGIRSLLCIGLTRQRLDRPGDFEPPIRSCFLALSPKSKSAKFGTRLGPSLRVVWDQGLVIVMRGGGAFGGRWCSGYVVAVPVAFLGYHVPCRGGHTGLWGSANVGQLTAVGGCGDECLDRVGARGRMGRWNLGLGCDDENLRGKGRGRTSLIHSPRRK